MLPKKSRAGDMIKVQIVIEHQFQLLLQFRERERAGRQMIIWNTFKRLKARGGESCVVCSVWLLHHLMLGRSNIWKELHSVEGYTTATICDKGTNTLTWLQGRLLHLFHPEEQLWGSFR